MKRPGSLIALYFSLAGFLYAFPAKLGDLDEDGQATVLDLVRIVNHLNRTHTLSNELALFADVNQDGFVSEADVTDFSRFILGTAPFEALPLTRIRETSPGHGEGGVAVTRETVFRFTFPLATNALVTTSNLYATFGGRRLLSRVELSTDRKSATLFYLENLPASARVRVRFDGSGLSDFLGRGVDLDGDGAAGGIAELDFDTLSILALPNTAVIGQVFASQPVAGTSTTNFINLPLEGVTITVDGAEETLRTETDSEGRFWLNPSPGGRFFVHVDGRTALGSQWPGGPYYPAVGKAWEAVPGRTNNLAGGTGFIYLPLITTGTLQTASMISDTTITFPPSVIASNPALAGVSITVPANSLFSDNGTRGGMVGIAPVPPDRLPEALPDGLNFPLVITIQTDGPGNFDRPVPVRFPNLPDPATGQPLLPGAKSALWSFNHDTGQWEIQGSMTVSADGLYVESDPGVGVKQPGWHGTQPGSSGSGGGAGDGDDDGDDDDDDPNNNDDDCDTKLALFGSAALQCLVKMASIFLPTHNPSILCAANVLISSSGFLLDCIIDNVACKKKLKKKVIITALGCIPVVGKPFGIAAQCLYFAQNAWEDYLTCIGFFDEADAAQAFVATAPPDGDYFGNLFSDQAELWADGAAFYDAFFGADKWTGIDPAEAQKFAHILELLDFATEDESDGGDRVTQAERQQISQLPVPAGFTSADVSALIDRFDQMMGNELSEGELNLPGILASAQKLSETALALENKGWSSAMEAFTVGLAQVFSLIDKSFDSSSVQGLSSISFPAQPAFSVQIPLVPPHYQKKVPFFYKLTDLASGFVRRGRLSSQGLFKGIILRPDTMYAVEYLAPNSLRVGVAIFKSGSVGSSFKIPRAVLFTPEPLDFDADGLSDTGELIVGTSGTAPDSDGDGIKDGAEIQQGTNPLDNSPSAIGIIASADTPGTALDICAINNLAIVADSDRGISVFNVSSGVNPVTIAQVDTPGTAQSVACSGNRIAVADGDAGLVIISIADPPAAQIVHQIPLSGSVHAVAAAAGIAYAGSSLGQIASVDMLSGTVLDTVSVGPKIHDVAVGGDTLYILTAGTLYTSRLNEGKLQISGSALSPWSVQVSGRRLRVFVGNEIAYATHGSGYNIFRLANPLQPTLIRQYNASEFGWKQIVANGSGLGIAAADANSTDDGPHDIWLYALGAAGTNSIFQTVLPTPGLARALSIYNGIAYVADGNSGMQVMNYLAPDAMGVPPAIFLSLNLTSNVMEEGKFLRVTARVADDVQVRNVEFFMDGVRVLTDGNYPFELRTLSPFITTNKTSFVLRARATDTGGNATWSDEITVNLAHDLAPPSIKYAYPPNGSSQRTGAVLTLTALFSEPILASTLNSDSFQLRSAGADRIFDTSDDTVLQDGVVTFREDILTGFLTFNAPLPIGLYRGLVRTSVTDLAELHLPTEFVWNFDVRAAVYWNTNLNGFWDEAAKWSIEALPQSNDFVLIDRPAGTFTITHRSGDTRITSLHSQEPFVLSGGSFSVSDSSQINNSFAFSAGIRTGAGDLAISGPSTWTGGTFDGGGRTWFNGGITITGSVNAFIVQHTLINSGPAIWDPPLNSGIQFNHINGVIQNAPGAVFDMRSDRRIVYGGLAVLPFPRFENFGTVLKSSGAGRVAFDRVAFNNDGVVQVKSGTLSLEAGGASSGRFQIDTGAVLRFGGFTHTLGLASSVQGPGTALFAGNTVVLNGVYNVSGQTTISNDNPCCLSDPNITFNGQVQNAGSLFVSSGLSVFNAPSVTITGPVSVVGGTVDFNHLGAPITPSSLLLSPGLSIPQIRGSGDIDVNGPFIWTGGSMGGSGRTRANGGLELSGNSGRNIGGQRKVENPGVALWTGNGDFSISAGATFHNLPGGLFEIRSNAMLSGSSDIGGFTNSGTVLKTAANGTNAFTAPFHNGGAVQIQIGGLRLGRRSIHTGNFDIAAGATLELAAANTFMPGSSISGAGTVLVSLGLVDFSGSYDIPVTVIRGSANVNAEIVMSTLHLQNGTLGGTGTLTVTGPFTWPNGTMNGPGRTRIEGDLTISGDNPKTASGRIIDNAGLVTWTGAGNLTMVQSAVFSNRPAATFEIQNNATIGNDFEGNPPRFANSGTVRKVGSPGFTHVYCRFTNEGTVHLQSGTVSFQRGFTQTSGTTLLDGGAIQMGSQLPGLLVAGGLLTGSGTINGRVTNNAAISPGASAGFLNIQNSYSQGPAGVLNIEIGGLIAKTNYDQVAITGQATLGGTLSVSLIDGFVPNLGDSFVVLTFGSRTNTFSVLTGLEIGAGKRFEPNYTTTNLTLQVVNSP